MIIIILIVLLKISKINIHLIYIYNSKQYYRVINVCANRYSNIILLNPLCRYTGGLDQIGLKSDFSHPHKSDRTQSQTDRHS